MTCADMLMPGLVSWVKGLGSASLDRIRLSFNSDRKRFTIKRIAWKEIDNGEYFDINFINYINFTKIKYRNLLIHW